MIRIDCACYRTLWPLFGRDAVRPLYCRQRTRSILCRLKRIGGSIRPLSRFNRFVLGEVPIGSGGGPWTSTGAGWDYPLVTRRGRGEHDIRERHEPSWRFASASNTLKPLLCRISCSTPEEALLKLDESFDDWIESMLEFGDEIPEPEQWPGGIWEQTPLPLSSREVVRKPCLIVGSIRPKTGRLFRTLQSWRFQDRARTAHTEPRSTAGAFLCPTGGLPA